MALHGKTQRTPKQMERHYSKPGRAKRLERRDHDRREELNRYIATRDYALHVGPFLPWRIIGSDEPRAFRIAEYLAKRAGRPANQRKAA